MVVRVLLWWEALVGVVKASHESLELSSGEILKPNSVDMVFSEHGATCSVRKEPVVVKTKHPLTTKVASVRWHLSD